MLTRVTDWLGEMRALWTELGRLEHEHKQPAQTQNYYGRLGEMGHPDDRADDWPAAHTGQ